MSVALATFGNLFGDCADSNARTEPQTVDLTSLAPKSCWRNSNKFSKHPVQLRCIVKPYRERHVDNRYIAFGQQCSCATDPLR